MKLSEQAMTCIMGALQKGILEQTDITEILKGFELVNEQDGLIVKNPPSVRFSDDSEITTKDLENIVK